MSREKRREIRLVQYEDRTWSATEELLDVTVEGETKEGVLEQLEAEIRVVPEVEVDEKTEEELEEEITDILSDTQSIENALDDLDEDELDDAEDFEV